MGAAGERLAEIVRGRSVAVIGVGNEMRGDDGAGVAVAAGLAARGVARVFDAGTVPENFLGPVATARPQVALFVDLAAHGARPGEWCVAKLDQLASRVASTHAASLSLCGRLLERQGVECWIVAIEPGGTAFGTGLCEAVESAVSDVTATLAGLLGNGVGGAG